MKNRHILGAMIVLAPVVVLAQVGTPPPVGNSMQTGAPSTTDDSDPAANPAASPAGDTTMGTDGAEMDADADAGATANVVANSVDGDSPDPKA